VNPAPYLSDDDQIDSRMPLWWAIIANIVSFVLSLQFFWVPSGAWIRPMGWTLWIFLIGVATLPVLPLILLNLKRLRGRTWPRYGITLALTPIPLALCVAGLAHKIIGFHYSP
jgi:uncharacterized membrane protein YhaH (DUF805 family)